MDKILVVDDEAGVRASFQKLLADQQVLAARRADEALKVLETEEPDLVIMDIHMPGMNGLEAFRQIRECHPRLPVIIMTGYSTTEFAIEATKLGAFDYQVKPFDPEEMLRLIDKALESVRLMQRRVELDPGATSVAGDALVGQSPLMQEVYKTIGRVAATDATVLIRGETGTGKELVARAVYQHSRRRQAPLLVVNCTAIPETLLESELFGYEKGAFTGAVTRRIGKFEQAHLGTLFLDEVGDMPLSTQAKILRFLQERTFERLGSSQTLRADVRLLAATNRDLEQAMAEGLFREDLYHRLNVVTIQLPPLRERRQDIPRLIDYFLERLSRPLGIDRPPLSAQALEVLGNHPWPGNVRELEHCLQRVLIFTRGHAVQADDVQSALEREAEALLAAPDEDDLRAFVRQYLHSGAGPDLHGQFMDLADKLLVAEALRQTSGNQTRAARLLGLTRPTLQAKMQKYGIYRQTQVRED